LAEQAAGVGVGDDRDELLLRLGLGHAVHRRSVDLLLVDQPAEDLLQPLCLFSAVEAERVSIIHAWNDSTCARVTALGSSAAASASGSGECSAR
jgi:hypothetical protein